ncbi:hypothetical protein ACSVBT_07175 [Afipia sp. TerB]
MGWKAKLIRPIKTAEGGEIVTLSDARDYLLKLPKDRHTDPIVQATIEAVMMAAEGRGPVFTAQAGISQVVAGRRGLEYDPDRLRLPTKKWGRRR